MEATHLTPRLRPESALSALNVGCIFPLALFTPAHRNLCSRKRRADTQIKQISLVTVLMPTMPQPTPLCVCDFFLHCMSAQMLRLYLPVKDVS